MFSLEEARLLDIRANETNFNSVVQILTGITIDANQQNAVVSNLKAQAIGKYVWVLFLG